MSGMLFKDTVTRLEAEEVLVSANKGIERDIEYVGLMDALDRYIAGDVVTDENVPGFSRSTVDGFAVNSQDTFGASPSLPAYLEVSGEIRMGEEALESLEPGMTVKISTGGMLPNGAAGVVMMEDTELLDNRSIGVFKPVTPGENVILKGDDYKTGDIIFNDYHRLRPQDLGALAAIGISKVPVYMPVSVGIISTGNEVISPEEKLVPGKIRDINTYALIGLVKRAGGLPAFYGIIRDDKDELKDAVEKALEDNQIVILSGGSSVGTRDYTLQVVEEFPELNMLFHGISIRPGKPTIAAAGEGKIFFGLPGNPVSAITVFKLLVSPIISGSLIAKEENLAVNTVNAKLARSLSSAVGREDYVRVRLLLKDDELYAEPVLGKSALISTLTKSDGEILIPQGKEGFSQFQEVSVRLFERGD